jgi:hypothetical protein
MGLEVGVRVNKDGIGLAVNEKRKISFLIARQLTKRKPGHAAQWRACSRRMPSGVLVVIRLNEANKAVQDYLLLPASGRTGPYLRLSGTSLARHKAVRVERLDELIGEVKARLGARGVSERGGSKQARLGAIGQIS